MKKGKLFLKEIVEGKTKLLVPDPKHHKKMEDAPVFYNPRMCRNRDISVIVAREFLPRKAHIADILTGAGAHAVRYANEGGFTVTINDASPTSVKTALRSAKLNKVASKIKTSKNEANKFLLKKRKKKFDCIDIDPFGSPAPFLDSAFRAVKANHGLLCITATDIGALAGSFPVAAYRRYGLRTGRTSFRHELGVRNLLAAVALAGAKYDIGIKPLLSYAEIHYYRVFVETEKGADLRNVGSVMYCPKCEFRKFVSAYKGVGKKFVKPKDCGHDELKVYGPVWIGKIHGKDFVGKIREHCTLLHKCWEEADIAEPYYDMHVLAKKYKLGARIPKLDKLIEKLRKRRYKAAQSAFCGYGLKTNAPLTTLLKVTKVFKC